MSLGGMPGYLSMATSIGEMIFGPAIQRQQANMQMADQIKNMPYYMNAMTTMIPPLGIRPFYDSATGRVIYESSALPPMATLRRMAMSRIPGEPTVDQLIVNNLNRRQQSFATPPGSTGPSLFNLFGLFGQ